MIIEKNIPIPTKNKYPLLDMEVGDSFFVSVEAGDLPKTRTRLNTAISRKGNTGRAFITRSVDGGLRVWRTE